jgi:pyridoxamine 5'-phosphate oxidase
MEPTDLASLRQSYDTGGLDEQALAADPYEQFRHWFADAMEAGLAEPNAMVLSTVSGDGTPSARTVLLKGYGADGFRFFTNHRSRKGRAIAENPRVCLLFPWHALHRQVIVEGSVVQLPAAESQEYFHSRPHGSQLGAWASERQSAVVTREELEGRYAELAERWPQNVPMPEFWGGYLVVPSAIEFWQGRTNRLHDRLRYRLHEDEWKVERLSP